MSSGTSAGNIITEATATYGVRTWLTTVKADAFGVISDAQLDSIIGANWFNNVDDNLKQLNQWFNGTGTATHIRATTATIGTCNFTTLGATSAMIGSGALSDAPTTADDVVVGNLGATDRGVSILSTTVARLAFVDTAATLTGYVAYTHATDTLSLGVAGATEVNLTATALAPHADGGLTLGDATHRFSETHTTDLTVYDDLVVSDAATVQTSVTVGDATASPTVKLNKDSAGTGDVLFQSESVSRWRLRHKTDGNLSLDRLDGSGVLQDSCIWDASTGGLTLPGALSLGGNLSATAANALVTLGSGAGAPTLRLDGSPASLYFADGGVDQFSIVGDGSLALTHSSGAGLTIDTSGGVSISNSLQVGSPVALAPVISLSKGDAVEGSLSFVNEDVTRWALVCDSSENLVLRRYNSGGTLQSTVTFSNSTGAWSLPNDVTLTGSGRTLTVGDNTGAAAISTSKSDASTGTVEFFSAAVKRWQIEHDTSENLVFRRYNSGGTLQDSTTVSNSDGTWSFPKGIGLSGSASRFTAGTGAPSGGSNGDLYWRTDGTASTCLYYRVGGVWTALAT